MKIPIIYFVIIIWCSCNFSKKKIVETYSNGKIKKECDNIIEGKYQGTCIEYHENDTVSVISNYENGELSGSVSFFSKEGNIEEYSNYSYGKLDGISEQYYKNGNKKSIAVFQKGIKLSEIFYSEDGKKQKETTFLFINEKPTYGIENYFVEDNVIARTYFYIIVNNKKIYNGNFEYDKNGNILNNESLYFKIIPEKDTIKQGENYSFNLKFIADPQKVKKIEILIGDFDESFEPINNTIDTIVSENLFANIRYTPKKSGNNILRGIIHSYSIYKESDERAYIVGTHYFIHELFVQ